MTKADLVNAMAGKAGITKAEAEKCLGAFIECVKSELQSGGQVALTGFGSFKISERKERQGVNPATKEQITIPAAKVPVFKAGKALKDAVNE